VVTTCEQDEGRRSVATSLGARHAVAPPPAGSALDADVVFEVTGTRGGLDLALASVRPGGRIVAVGLQEPSTLDLRSLALREISLVGTVAHRCARDMPAALRLLGARAGGWSDIAPTAIPLEALVEDGLRPLASGTSQRIKTLVDPTAGAARPTVVAPIAAVV